MPARPDIPLPEYEIFKSPPLKTMLGQVRFPPILKIAELGSLAGFQEALREAWPEFAPEQQISLVLSPGTPPAEGGIQQLFRFTSADKSWSALLAPDVLTLEATAAGPYSSFDDFSERFREVWSALLEHFRPAAVVRQGLRYVDHLEDERDPTQWAELINPDLLGPLAGSLAGGLEQALSDFRFRFDEGILIFKHGIVRAGPENSSGYLLDFDFFTDTVNEDVALDPLMERFTHYHDELYALFRWCVTEKAIEGFRRDG